MGKVPQAGINRLRMIEIVPVMTAKVPVTVRALMRSRPRRNTTVRIRVHSGVEATMGETTTTRPRLTATRDSSEAADSKKPDRMNGATARRLSTKDSLRRRTDTYGPSETKETTARMAAK
ncbi:MAG: hypothetical protein OXU42_18500 [Deltaproteobacteria bacterium]|nr:hypothetical protein [Deltaproteobacteria bacterium]